MKGLQLNLKGMSKPRIPTLNKEWSMILSNPPEHITPMVWKPKKYGGFTQVAQKVYLTANLWYGTHGHTKNEKIIRASAKKVAMLSMHQIVMSAPICEGKVRITITYYSPKEGFDIDNKGYFWCKIFQDYLENRGKILTDTVKHIEEVYYRYKKSDITQIEFRITQL